jgi:uncharacterized membrane protein (DUF106 family)
MTEVSFAIGGLSMLILEGLKWVIRTWFIKDAEFSFSATFYAVVIPVLNVLLIPVMAVLGVGDYTIPADWVAFLRTVIVVLLATLISTGGYTVSLKQFKEYKKSLKESEESLEKVEEPLTKSV